MQGSEFPIKGNTPLMTTMSLVGPDVPGASLTRCTKCGSPPLPGTSLIACQCGTCDSLMCSRCVEFRAVRIRPEDTFLGIDGNMYARQGSTAVRLGQGFGPGVDADRRNGIPR